jgi:hypothetical protein
LQAEQQRPCRRVSEAHSRSFRQILILTIAKIPTFLHSSIDASGVLLDFPSTTVEITLFSAAISPKMYTARFV